MDNGRVSPAPDAAQRDAAHQLQLNRRMREVEASILSRAPEHDLEPSLDRIRAVMELLGDPQRTFPVIHVTGTNGKTSTARIIEALMCDFRVNRADLLSFDTTSDRVQALFDGAVSAFPGMLELDATGLAIPPASRPLTRMIARAFDAYDTAQARHSSAV